MRGVYILLFKITKDFSKHVGSLGKIQFEKGNYAYVGSAQSSVLARLERHFSKKKKMHWHIDYFEPHFGFGLELLEDPQGSPDLPGFS